MPDLLHPHYEEVGVTHDAGFLYSDWLPDTPTAATPRNKAVARLSPALSRLNPTQLIALADLVGPKIAPTASVTLRFRTSATRRLRSSYSKSWQSSTS